MFCNVSLLFGRCCLRWRQKWGEYKTWHAILFTRLLSLSIQLSLFSISLSLALTLTIFLSVCLSVFLCLRLSLQFPTANSLLLYLFRIICCFVLSLLVALFFYFCVFAYWKTSWQFANECNEKRHFPTPSAELHYFRPFNKTFIASLSPSLSNFPLFAIKKQLFSTENCCFIYQEKKGLHSLKTAFLPKLLKDEIGWKQKWNQLRNLMFCVT